jgi:choline kinase
MNKALASTFLKVLNRALEKHPGRWFSQGNPDYNVLFAHNGVGFILSRYLNQFNVPAIGVYDLDERGTIKVSESISSEKEPALYEEFSTIYNRIKDQVAQNKIHVLEESMGKLLEG